MGRGAVSSEGSSGEGVQHFSTLRARAVGAGDLRMVVHSMDYIKSKEMLSFPLQNTSRIQSTRIVNFVEQRASFEFAHLVMDDYVKINRIIIHMKEIYTSHPG